MYSNKLLDACNREVENAIFKEEALFMRANFTIMSGPYSPKKILHAIRDYKECIKLTKNGHENYKRLLKICFRQAKEIREIEKRRSNYV